MTGEVQATAATIATSPTPAVPTGELLPAESTASEAVEEVTGDIAKLAAEEPAAASAGPNSGSDSGPESQSSVEEKDGGAQEEEKGGDAEDESPTTKVDAKGTGRAEGPVGEDGFVYSADPEPLDGTPHPSGLTHEERLAIVKKQAEAAREKQRGEYLLANIHTGDIIVKTTSPENGHNSMRLHREILEKESGWAREHLPPPNKDGSPVTFSLGEGSISIYGQIFLFMYTHHLPLCEPDEGNPLNLCHVLCNIQMFMLATSWKVPRLQDYNLRHVERAIKTLKGLITDKGSLAFYRLHPTQYEECETKLRFANTCLCRDLYYPDDTKKMLLRLARLNIIVVPWMKKQTYLRPSIEQFWFRMKEYYFPWREIVWRLRRKGVITDDEAPDGWDWLGPEIPSDQVEKAVAQYDF